MSTNPRFPDEPDVDRDFVPLAARSSSKAHPFAPGLVVAKGLLLVSTVALVFFLVVSGGFSSAQNEDEDTYDPQLFREVVRRLEQDYFDPERIRPRELVARAFGALESAVDEIYVDNSDPDDPWLRVHVGPHTEAFNLNDIPNQPAGLPHAMRSFLDLLAFLDARYDGDASLADIQYAVLNGFLGGLDPHTLVFSPKAFREFFVHIEGEIYGVGMYVGNRDGKLKVIEVLKDTPAARAKFKKHDIITRIGDESTINMTVNEAVERIRGERFSKITLTVKRSDPDGSGKLITLPITVERDRVVIKSVESKLIEDWDPDRTSPWKGGVGYVQVRNFDKQTMTSLDSHLRSLREQNGGTPLAGLVLDLRGNSGGLLSQAIEMSDHFLESGSIVHTAVRGKVDRTTPAEDDGDEPVYPIVVLADESSASGAEIVVGALQRNNRALFVGSPTFGKGSVQQLHGLPNGAQLKITVSEYLLPDKISIQENGVTPDILAHQVRYYEEKRALEDGGEDSYVAYSLFPDERRNTESDYRSHIVSRFARKEEAKYTIQYLEEPIEEDPDSDSFISGELQPEKDPLVQAALGFLRIANAPFDPKALLEKKKPEILALRSQLFEDVVAKLAEKGIDWKDGPLPKDPRIELELARSVVEEPSDDPDDPVPVRRLVVTGRATNRGAEPIVRLKGLSRSENYDYQEREFLFGRVEPGKTVERVVKIPLPYFPVARVDDMTVEVSSWDDKVLASRSLRIELEELPRPSFSYAAELIDAESSEKLDELAPGRTALLRARLKNTGKAPAHKGVAILRNETGRQIFLEKGRIEFDELEPGGEETVEFRFQVRDGDPVDRYEFQLAFIDSYSGVTLSRELSIRHAGKPATPPFPHGIAYSQPHLEVAVSDSSKPDSVVETNKASVRLQAKIESPDGTPFEAWVVTQRLDAPHSDVDKTYFKDSEGRAQLEISQRLTLQDGINLVSLFAKDRHGIETRRNMVIRKLPTQAAANTP